MTVYGVQTPRIHTVPAGAVSTAGDEAIELARRAGLVLDPWQQLVLREGMAEDAAGRWAAFEVCTSVPRQNGKGAIIEARELWGLFIGGEELILHSAHELKTAKKSFRRLERRLRACPDLHKRVKRYWHTTGEEAVELHTGQLLQYIARSGGSGRGFDGECNIMDEDMILGDAAIDALLPTMAAMDDPQIWYLGSAGIGAPSVQLARLRRRALAAVESGTPDPSLCYLEWSAEGHAAECAPECTTHDDLMSDEAALKSNPGVGYRLTLEKIGKERASMSATGYARERLGVGDYPADVEDTWQVIPEVAWRALADPQAAPGDPVTFAVDATPERSHAAICAAGQYGPVAAVEVIDHRPGIGWVVARARELQEKWGPTAWVIDAGGPAGSLIPELERPYTPEGADGRERPGLVIVQPTVREVAQAAGGFYDAVIEKALAHRDPAPLATALAGAQKRSLGDAWAWARRGVGVDISPLVAATNALWGHATYIPEDEGAPNLW
jgi:hypothetical protein